MRYGNAKAAEAGSRGRGRQHMPAKRKISSTNCSDRRQSQDREREGGRKKDGGEFKVQLQ